MYKKILSFLLIFSVSITMLLSVSFPASATSGSSVNILDFVSRSDGSNTFTAKSTSTYSYSLTGTLGSVRAYFVDIVFVSTGIPLTSIIINRDGTNDFTGTITQLGTSLYRVTCNMEGLVVKSFNLKFTNSGSSYSYITLLSFDVHTVPSNRVNIAATVSATPGTIATLSPGGSVSVQSTPVTSSTFNAASFSVKISQSYWQDYDYIDFSGAVSCFNVNSITVFCSNDSYIPIEYNFVNSGIVDSSDSSRAYFYFSSRIDLSSVDKSSISGDIQVIISVTVDDSALLTVSGLSGVIIGEPVDVQATWYQILFRNIKSGFESVVLWLKNIGNGLTSWFSTLFSKFDTLIQSLAPSSVDEEITNEMQQSENELGNLSDQMEELSPTIDAVDVKSDVDDLVSADGVNAVNSVFNIFTGNAFIATILTISIAMATAGYVFFGKR